MRMKAQVMKVWWLWMIKREGERLAFIYLLQSGVWRSHGEQAGHEKPGNIGFVRCAQRAGIHSAHGLTFKFAYDSGSLVVFFFGAAFALLGSHSFPFHVSATVPSGMRVSPLCASSPSPALVVYFMVVPIPCKPACVAASFHQNCFNFPFNVICM